MLNTLWGKKLATFMLVAVAAATGTAAGVGAASAAPAPILGPLPPIAQLDVQRYLGVWNQVAAIPQPFNLNCARNTRATYTLIDANNVGVQNTCTTFAGRQNSITGNARVNDPVTKAQLHVSFPGIPFQSNPAGPTNYVVTYIAPDYGWALVGSPDRLSGFVLKRSPGVSSSQWQEIRGVIRARGYNPCAFVTSPADGGPGSIVPVCTVA